MDERISKLETPEECEQFAINVQDRQPERAKAARRRAVELRAAKHGAKTDVERDAFKAVCAYEYALIKKSGKTARASRTWPMIKRHGIIPTVEKIVRRKNVTSGYKVLLEMGMPDFAFEAVVCRHRSVFSAEAVKCAEKRLKELEDSQR